MVRRRGALQSSRAAKTLRWNSGKVQVTDGPYAETKEQLGGFFVLEAQDMNQAVELMSKHPGVRIGPFEVRPVDEKSLQRQQASERQAEGRSSTSKTTNRKFLCLGYIDPKKGETMSKADFEAMIEQCIAFDEARRSDGQWISGVGLQGNETAKTLRSKDGKVTVTDGPFAETKEYLGGVVALAMRDINHAVEVLSTHPALRFGVVIEIRPADEEFNAAVAARQGRCAIVMAANPEEEYERAFHRRYFSARLEQIIDRDF